MTKFLNELPPLQVVVLTEPHKIRTLAQQSTGKISLAAVTHHLTDKPTLNSMQIWQICLLPAAHTLAH